MIYILCDFNYLLKNHILHVLNTFVQDGTKIIDY